MGERNLSSEWKLLGVRKLLGDWKLENDWKLSRERKLLGDWKLFGRASISDCSSALSSWVALYVVSACLNRVSMNHLRWWHVEKPGLVLRNRRKLCDTERHPRDCFFVVAKKVLDVLKDTA